MSIRWYNEGLSYVGMTHGGCPPSSEQSAQALRKRRKSAEIDPESELLAMGVELQATQEYHDRDWMTPWARRKRAVFRHRKLCAAAAGLVVGTAFVESGAADMAARGTEYGYEWVVDGLANWALQAYKVGAADAPSPTDISLTPEDSELAVVWVAGGDSAGAVQGLEQNHHGEIVWERETR